MIEGMPDLEVVTDAKRRTEESSHDCHDFDKLA